MFCVVYAGFSHHFLLLSYCVMFLKLLSCSLCFCFLLLKVCCCVVSMILVLASVFMFGFIFAVLFLFMVAFSVCFCDLKACYGLLSFLFFKMSFSVCLAVCDMFETPFLWFSFFLSILVSPFPVFFLWIVWFLVCLLSSSVIAWAARIEHREGLGRSSKHILL